MQKASVFVQVEVYVSQVISLCVLSLEEQFPNPVKKCRKQGRKVTVDIIKAALDGYW